MFYRSLAFFTSMILAFSVLGFLSFSSDDGKVQAVTRKMPVLELFTAEWCGPCVAANEALDEVYDEMGSGSFVMIKQHLQGNGGMSNSYSLRRANQFGIRGVPTGILDAKDVVSHREMSDARALRTRLNILTRQNTPVRISFDGEIKNGQIQGQVNYSNAPSGSTLHVVQCEAYFYFRARNGERVHRMISRGADLFSIGVNGTQDVSIDVPSRMAYEMLRLVIFVESSNGISQALYWNPTGMEFEPGDAILSSTPNEVNFDVQHEGFSSNFDLSINNFSNKNAPVTITPKDNYIHVQSEEVTVGQESQIRNTISLRTSQLRPGKYESAIEVSSGNYQKTIPIRFQIIEQPELQVAKEILDFGEVRRGDRSTIELVISNKKEGAIQGSISSRSRWLDFSPSDFNRPEQTILVRANTRDLQAGIHETDIRINSNGGQATLQAKINVLASLLESNIYDIDFGEVREENLPETSYDLILTNKGSEPAEVSVNNVPLFIMMDTDSFKLLPEEEKAINIGIDPRRVQIDALNECVITFEYTDGELSIPVSIYVKEMSPILEVNADDLENGRWHIDARAGEKFETSIVVENVGKGRLEGNISLKNKSNWLSLSHEQFALLGGQRRTITATIDTDNLSSGQHEETIVIESNGGSEIIEIQLLISAEEIVIVLQIGSSNATVSGNPVTVDPPPYIKEGTTLVPLRFISEAFGADIEWNPSLGRGTITIRLEDHLIQIEIGNPNAQVNGNTMPMAVPPEIVDGRTFVPLRFISEAFGAQVEWDGATQTIRIIYAR